MKRPAGWPLGITILLLAFAAGNIQMMRIANDDPSFALEPDYYQKAVAFDTAMAQERRNAALGWTATSRIGRHRVAVRITDASGNPVGGGRVSIDARFNARAAEIMRATLTESSPGVYEAPLDVRYPGEWEVRVQAIRGSDLFTASTRAQAAAQ